ncbi:MAG: lysophospholipid acyltransferase family protein [Flavobacteriales bacterium]
MNVLGWILAPFRTVLVIAHTIFCSLVGLVAMALNKNNGDWVMWNVGRVLWSRPLLRRLVGVKIEVHVSAEAQALADQKKGCVLVANHTSLLDINAAFAASPTPIVFLSKASIRRVPLLGKLNELAGTVFVERGNRASSERAVNQLTESLKAGRSVLVFPEGTRSKDGTLQPFKKGAFHLAQAAGAPIVPMHISGTWDLLPPSGMLIGPAKKSVRVAIGAPLAYPSHATPSEMLEHAQAAVKLLST